MIGRHRLAPWVWLIPAKIMAGLLTPKIGTLPCSTNQGTGSPPRATSAALMVPVWVNPG